MLKVASMARFKFLYIFLGLHVLTVVFLIYPVSNKLSFEDYAEKVYLQNDNVQVMRQISSSIFKPITNVYKYAIFPIVAEELNASSNSDISLIWSEKWTYLGFQKSMFIDETQIVNFVLSDSEFNAFEKAAINSSQEGKKVKNLSRKVKATLNGIDFKISKQEETQLLKDKTINYWTWTIRPERIGMLNINVIFTSYYIDEAGKEIPDVKLNLNKLINVEQRGSFTNIVNNFINTNIPMLSFLTLIFTALAALKAAFLVKT
ncbi:hypothetical protein ESZ36_00340 [Colwellia demingiae]|uniref:Uncharacterized protein n=1 Tax=Colwellia demingiae TaxID=89401 RepID=A0A5C6QSY0_9GAMM|nr:hypothetical protein [Colwellia demingiae]TWX71720.1 hypothetical protein ESZ36_00340 [Colwellia demingiae]